VDSEGKTDGQVADEGLIRLESWMRDLGVAMDLTELGVTEDMIEGIADSTILTGRGYKVLDRDDVMRILKKSL
jgi:alcohol dehydrogenase YqhD (iron-dependent ADH family)